MPTFPTPNETSPLVLSLAAREQRSDEPRYDFLKRLGGVATYFPNTDLSSNDFYFLDRHLETWEIRAGQTSSGEVMTAMRFVDKKDQPPIDTAELVDEKRGELHQFKDRILMVARGAFKGKDLALIFNTEAQIQRKISGIDEVMEVLNEGFDDSEILTKPTDLDLSDIERSVLWRYARPTKQIAEDLGIAESTVNSKLSRIKKRNALTKIGFLTRIVKDELVDLSGLPAELTSPLTPLQKKILTEYPFKDLVATDLAQGMTHREIRGIKSEILTKMGVTNFEQAVMLAAHRGYFDKQED